VPPVDDGSSNVTACPDLMLMLVPDVKLNVPISTVALLLPPLVVAVGAVVGAAVVLVAVGLPPAFVVVVPQAASTANDARAQTSANLRITRYSPFPRGWRRNIHRITTTTAHLARGTAPVTVS
jgi:hypothetical protein